MTYEILPIILVVIAVSLLLIKGLKRRAKESREIVFQDVWDYFKENGFLKECQKGGYKFSTSKLKNLMKYNLTLSQLNIEDIEDVDLIDGVGPKVKDLIQMLVTKYREERCDLFSKN